MLSQSRTADGSAPLLQKAIAELEQRLRTGEACRAEDLLAALPDLLSDIDAALELVYTEFVLRMELEQKPTPAEYYQRFPAWEERLRRLFEVHQAVCNNPTNRLPSGEAPPAGEFSNAETRDLPPADSSPVGDTLSMLSQLRSGDVPPRPELCDFLTPPLKPDELGGLGPYRVLKILGAGGMGVVFQALDPQLNRFVALKVMRPALAASDSARKRFLREAQLAATIQHDHIIPILHVGEDRGVPYLAMPFLQGESLEERLQREKRLSGPEVLRIGREISQGLAAAHKHGLIHRDIKPANIWLEAETGRVKILDFGLARTVGSRSSLSQQGAIIGTPAFMAPEQVEGTTVDARCDLFSLGCVLYTMCTGTLAFQRKDIVGTLLAVATHHPTPLADLGADFPAGLSELVKKLLAKNAENRPASADVVLEAIRRIEAGDIGPHADEASVAERMRAGQKHGPRERPAAAKHAARRWLVWVVGGAVAVGVVVVAWIPQQRQKAADLPTAPTRAEVEYVPPGCTPPPTATVVEVAGKQRLFSQLDYCLPDDTKIRFLLIPRETNRDPHTFYIMENKVTNKLFGAFMKSKEAARMLQSVSRNRPWVLKGKWTKGASAGDKDLGATDPDLPVFRVTVLEAYCFANWLGGDLPQAAQWDKAAGLFQKNPRPGPFDPTWDSKARDQIAVDRWREGPMRAGKANKDVSPFGCRDMSGNGSEWTRSLLWGMNDAKKHDRVRLRGRSYKAPTPLKFRELVRMSESTQYQDAEDDIGFRVVIEIPLQIRGM
jgi:serine/threonine protein kinase